MNRYWTFNPEAGLPAAMTVTLVIHSTATSWPGSVPGRGLTNTIANGHYCIGGNS